VGEATVFAMLIEIPKLRAMEHKCAASRAGLAPMAQDSDQRRGKRFIQGGRLHLRQALYMPALVAVRFNAAMKAKCPHRAGNHPKSRSPPSCAS
jgi:transposase